MAFFLVELLDGDSMSKSKNTSPTMSAEELYKRSRAGAVSYRGYHFQDVIGAWIAARLLAGELGNVDRIVPEDWEDLSLEGPDWTHIQVKSRQRSRGPFHVSEVAKFIVEMWEKHFERKNVDIPSDKLILVLERGLDMDTPSEVELPITDIPQWPQIRRNIESKSPALVERIDSLVSRTYVHVIDIATANNASATLIETTFDSYHSAARHVRQVIQNAVGTCTEQNAIADMKNARAGLGRSDLRALSDKTLSLIDHESLEDALRSGDCEVLDFSTEEDATGFYHGVSVQPGHITANLAASRPELVEEGLTSLRAGTHVLFNGVSGVGKSTVMWQTAYSSPGILWYRIRPSAGEQSFARIWKLIEALAPTTDRQVGLVLDDVGREQTRLWDRLVREASALPGLILLGSIRAEDLHQIETRSSLEVIEVKLDEATASLIHAKLLQDGATNAEHWREAYRNSNSLTMEYTHILTQGKRLAVLVEEQIGRRVRENRELELEVIALVATADQWGATIDLDALVAVTGANRNDFRKALARLSEEHILRQDHQNLRGVHQLRSQFLSQAIHDLPPPSLQQTVKTLLRIVTPDNLGKIIRGSSQTAVLSRDALLDELADRVVEASLSQQPEFLSYILQALRDIDFRQRISELDDVLDSSGVPIPLRVTTLQLAMTETSFERLIPSVKRALPQLQRMLKAPYRFPSDLLEHLPSTYVIELLASSKSVDTVIQILSSLIDVEFDWDLVDTAALAGSHLEETLRTIETKELGTLLILSKFLNAKFTALLSEMAGGRDELFKRLKAENPYIVSAAMVEKFGENIPTVRILCGSVGTNTDFDQSNRDTAKLVAQLFPLASHVDVRTQFAGALPIKIGGFEHGVSTLKQEYIHASSVRSWRRRMLAMATFQYSPGSQTERTSLAASLLKDVERFITALAKNWLLNDRENATSMTSIHGRVQSKLSTLAPFVAPRFADPDEFELQLDALYSFVDSVFNNVPPRLVKIEGYAALSTFLLQHLRRSLREIVSTEAWELIDYDPCGTAERIDDLLLALGRLVAEIHQQNNLNESILLRARSGSPKTSIKRAGDLANRFQTARRTTFLEQFIKSLRKQGLEITYYTRECDPARIELWPHYELLILIQVPRLMDWSRLLGKLVEVLDYDKKPYAVLPEIRVAPSVKGHPVSRLCFRVGNNVLLDPDGLAEWTNEIGEIPELPFTSTLLTAREAMEGLSNIAYLGRFRDIGALEDSIEALSQQYNEATDRLLSFLSDDPRLRPFLEWISGLSRRVLREFDDSHDPMDVDELYYAVECVKVALEPESVPSANQTLEAVVQLAIQYDIDPEDAALVGFLEGEDAENSS